MNSFFLRGLLNALLSLRRLLAVRCEGAERGASTRRSQHLAAVPSLGVDPREHQGGVCHCSLKQMRELTLSLISLNWLYLYVENKGDLTGSFRVRGSQFE